VKLFGQRTTGSKPRRAGIGLGGLLALVVAGIVGAGGTEARADNVQYGAIFSYSIGTLGDSGTQTVYGSYTDYGSDSYEGVTISDGIGLYATIGNGILNFTPFEISTNPVNQKVGVGESAYFSANTSGGDFILFINGPGESATTPTTTYAWQASTDGGTTWANLTDDGTYAGTATNTLTVVSPTLAMNGTLVRMLAQQLLGTNVIAQAGSTPATLTVVNGSPVDVTLSSNGMSAEATLGVQMWANSTAEPAANFTWEKSTDGGVTWQVVSGDTVDNDGTEEAVSTSPQAALDISNLTLDASGWEYRVTAENRYGSATSAPVTLTVLAPTPPVFTTQPASAVITMSGNGSIVDFYTNVTSVTALSYAWEASGDGGKTWLQLAETNGPHLEVGDVLMQWVPELEFRCEAINAWGTLPSEAAVLNVQAPVQVSSTSLNSLKQAVLAGGRVTLTPNTSGAGTLTYQWLKNGKPIKGATGATLVLSNVQAADAGAYSVKVSSSAGGVVESTASLQVTASAPMVVKLSGPASVAKWGTTTLTVQAQGTAPMSYRWEKNGVLLNNSGTVKGATTASLTLSWVTAARSAGNYQVVIKNSAGMTTSSNVTLTVN